MRLIKSECSSASRYVREMEDTYSFPVDTKIDDIDTTIIKMYKDKRASDLPEITMTKHEIRVTVVWYDRIHQ